jgi:3-oxoacyl-[acyl-carrier protein] reductase
MKPVPPQIPTVLITGAAGGLGRALTAEFLRQGWRVAAGWYRTELIERDPTSPLWPIPLDVTNPAHFHTAIPRILERWGHVDALIHNAGLNLDQPLWHASEIDWNRVLDVNLNGARRCAQAILPHMIQRHSGHILNIGSFTARIGARGQSAYATAKAALAGLTLALAREIGSHNIQCNLVLPGLLHTPMTAHLPPTTLAAITEANVLHRLNDPLEVARFIVFLSSTRNISGQCFQLDSRIASWT